MNVVVQGRQRRFLSADIGGTPVQEIWLGDKQIWPNMEGVATRIVVALPQVGTRDWQYWVHALDATKDKATPANYMKFVVDEMDFFINHSYDGSTPYRLDGNELTIDLYDGVLIDQLGEYLEVEAKIPEREGIGQGSDVGFTPMTYYWEKPLLPYTKIMVDWWGGKRGKPRWLQDVEIKGTPGLDTYFFSSQWSAGSGRGDYWNQTVASLGENVNPADTGFQIRFCLGGWAGVHKKGMRPVFPAFTRKFKLKIISVE